MVAQKRGDEEKCRNVMISENVGKYSKKWVGLMAKKFSSGMRRFAWKCLLLLFLLKHPGIGCLSHFFFFLLIKSLQFKYLFFIFTVFFFYQTTFISCPFLFLCFLTYLFPLREFDATHQLYQLNIKQNTVRQSK